MGDSAVLEGIDRGVDTTETMQRIEALQQSQTANDVTVATPVIQMDVLPPKYLL